MTTCMAITTLLERRMNAIAKDILTGSTLNWKARVKTVWNEREIKELLQQLGDQQKAINLLIGLLQIRVGSNIISCLDRMESSLRPA